VQTVADWCLVSFTQPKWRGFGEKVKKKGLKGAATGIGFAAPFVCFFFLVMCPFCHNICLPCVYALGSVFIVQESHRM
jgi:hypothetical protein